MTVCGANIDFFCALFVIYIFYRRSPQWYIGTPKTEKMAFCFTRYLIACSAEKKLIHEADKDIYRKVPYPNVA